MAELAAPLLPDRAVGHGYSKNRPFLLPLARWTLKSLMWLLFISWFAVIFFYPTEFMRHLFSKWVKITGESVFRITGMHGNNLHSLSLSLSKIFEPIYEWAMNLLLMSNFYSALYSAGSVFLLFSGPILIMAFLAFLYVTAFSRDNFEKKNPKFPRRRLWTFPILVDGPFGVVSAAELIGILMVTVYVLWSITVYTMQNYRQTSEFSLLPKEKSYLMMELTGLRLGSIGLFCLAFLFLPVARGSILLRLIDIPFEHATRYHVWLGHLTMAIFTLHGICYMISWALRGCLLEKMVEWKDIGVANRPGVYALVAGLLMWVTSLHPMRKNYFELFFYTHQLHMLFVVYLALHVGDFIFSIAAGAIFLFILDRFLRFCQSRTTVDVISAACHPCGTVELILSKPANLRYNALSFIFVQVRELSRLQWHPFSVSSSPLDGRHHISVLIKVLGKWTGKLRDIVSNGRPDQPRKDLRYQPLITVSVEGPYGHESPYHLMYENLILVAGGIGISPFLAILSDILHRIREEIPCFRKNVLVIWAVKRSEELSLLSVVHAQSICPSLSDKLHLDIQAYVTQESTPPLEDGKLDKGMIPSSISITSGSSMSSLVGTGNNVWSGIYFVVSTVGFAILFGLVEVYYIRPYDVVSWWYRGLLFTWCMVASVVILGGIVVFLWNQWEKRNSSNEEPTNDNGSCKLGQYNGPTLHCETGKVNLASFQTTQYGRRPDFQEIFNCFSEHVGRDDVGVIVCGPPGLQSSVAKECRSRNIKGRRNQPIFHFNSHSFDL